MTEHEVRVLVCAQARSWLGRKEADGSHREIIDVYNTIRPLPRGVRMAGHPRADQRLAHGRIDVIPDLFPCRRRRSRSYPTRQSLRLNHLPQDHLRRDGPADIAVADKQYLYQTKSPS